MSTAGCLDELTPDSLHAFYEKDRRSEYGGEDDELVLPTRSLTLLVHGHEALGRCAQKCARKGVIRF
jgi:hypothetical protein